MGIFARMLLALAETQQAVSTVMIDDARYDRCADIVLSACAFDAVKLF